MSTVFDYLVANYMLHRIRNSSNFVGCSISLWLIVFSVVNLCSQKQHFHSLSCPGFSFFETCHSFGDASPIIIPSQSETTRTCPSESGAGFGQSLHQRVGNGEEDSSDEQEEDTDSACSVGSRCDSPNRGEEEDEEEEDEEHGTFWKDSRRLEEKEAACQLDEELDIEQIERN